MFLTKKWGILIKKESESLIFTGLKIPRDYLFVRRMKWWKVGKDFLIEARTGKIFHK